MAVVLSPLVRAAIREAGLRVIEQNMPEIEGLLLLGVLHLQATQRLFTAEPGIDKIP